MPQPLVIEVGGQRLELGEYYATVEASDVSLIPNPTAGPSPIGSPSDTPDAHYTSGSSASSCSSASSSSSGSVWVRVAAAASQVVLTRQPLTAETDEAPNEAT